MELLCGKRVTIVFPLVIIGLGRQPDLPKLYRKCDEIAHL
jgi:hypothetical protein